MDRAEAISRERNLPIVRQSALGTIRLDRVVQVGPDEFATELTIRPVHSQGAQAWNIPCNDRMLFELSEMIRAYLHIQTAPVRVEVLVTPATPPAAPAPRATEQPTEEDTEKEYIKRNLMGGRR